MLVRSGRGAAKEPSALIGRHVRLHKSGVVGIISSVSHGWIWVNPDKGGAAVHGHGTSSLEFLDDG